MIVFQEKKYLESQSRCNELLSYDEIRFAGIVNKLGNLTFGGFKDGINPFETDEKCRMMYMQMVLEISMRRDFDSSLGTVEYIASKRENALMISIPIKDDLLLISATHHASTDIIIDKVRRIFSQEKGLEEIV